MTSPEAQATDGILSTAGTVPSDKPAARSATASFVLPTLPPIPDQAAPTADAEAAPAQATLPATAPLRVGDAQVRVEPSQPRHAEREATHATPLHSEARIAQPESSTLPAPAQPAEPPVRVTVTPAAVPAPAEAPAVVQPAAAPATPTPPVQPVISAVTPAATSSESAPVPVSAPAATPATGAPEPVAAPLPKQGDLLASSGGATPHAKASETDQPQAEPRPANGHSSGESHG